MADTYYTLAGPSEGIYKEKMSKFMAFATPVGSAAEAKAFIGAVQKKYFDARHVCWAYMIGSARSEFLSSDNGEPSGTAGKPILGQINSFNLTNVAIAVVRYFGGIKLGTSGLIVAYREAAREAIEAGEIIELHDMEDISFTYPYLSMEGVMRLAKGGEAIVIEQKFDNVCSMKLRIRADHADELRRRLGDIEGVSILTTDQMQ
ncbi:MAG: YigZ family protein [Muribaculaceae bacterium]|nr:YigZ family protein [Muribaculaceae bacterium]